MNNYPYQVGGSLPIDAPTYIKRQADDDFYLGLKAREFCYVLNSRQMGKSSLRVQTMKRLQADGIACVAIDLTAIGSQDISVEQWYAGIIYTLASNLEILDIFDISNWWSNLSFLTPIQKLSQFIETVILPGINQSLVIFVDEIDSTLSLPFSIDDFFALIRACYNKRADNPNYQKLTFALLGVATPSDLISDRNRTPFNIGRAIQLTGFKLHETTTLAPGLAAKADNPLEVLKAILAWTDGQPFLTQKICQLVMMYPFPIAAGGEEKLVANLVRVEIIENWEAKDEPEHLKTIRDRLLKNQQKASRLLGLYQQVLQNNSQTSININSGDSLEQIELNLTGLVVKQQGGWKVKNQIYQTIFNQEWVEIELAKLRPYSQAIAAWLTSNRQDKSRLLRGQALQEALEWKIGKNLSAEDNDFLAASQELALAEMQKELTAERQAKQILETAKQTAEKLLQQAREAQQKAEQMLAEAKAGIQIENSGIEALKKFAAGGREIEALLIALKAGKTLKKWVKDGRQLKNYPATKPIFALQQILQKIRERNKLLGHRRSVNSVTFSPNGKYLATASTDCCAILWDFSGKQITKFRGHKQTVNSVTFSPDGKYIATASTDGNAIIWDLSGNKILTLTEKQSISDICFSPCGQFIVTVSSYNKARLWDRQGKQLREFKGLPGGLTCLKFSPDGKHLVIASSTGIAKIWDFVGNYPLGELTGHQDRINCISFSPDGEIIATAANDGTAKIWNLFGYQLAELTGHYKRVNSVIFSPDGKHIATASADGITILWDLDGNQIDKVEGHQKPVNSISFSPDGKYLATALSDKTTRLWDLSPQQTIELRGHECRINCVSFSPSGEYLATGAIDGNMALWNVSGEQISILKAHQEWVRSVCFSPNGEYIATSSNDRTAKLWDLSGNLIVEFAEHQRTVASISFSPNGNSIATASADGIVRIWDLSGKKNAEFLAHYRWIRGLKFSPNGNYLVTASDDYTAKLWDLSGKLITDFRGHQNEVKSVSFSNNGEYIVTGSGDYTAKLWDLSGKAITQFLGHEGWVLTVSFSNNDEYIATGAGDGTTRLWDLNGNLLALFEAKQEKITSVSFSPNGKFLAAASDAGVVRLWRIETLDELLARGYEWLKYYLANHPELGN
ncbi:eIF2A-related protein [Dapis sp. BLCC M126]|uniref:WD40 domain-containing protein n=1 Tax=Dapis sp. BLCC M126 TaxID=3400189 RepID=UPI003CFA227A